jgi:hypothetical protein
MRAEEKNSVPYSTNDDDSRKYESSERQGQGLSRPRDCHRVTIARNVNGDIVRTTTKQAVRLFLQRLSVANEDLDHQLELEARRKRTIDLVALYLKYGVD